MERVKVSLPAHFPFSTFLKIRITDLNYGGHVGNDMFLSLVHEARQQYLQCYGYSELAFEGTGLIMVDAAIAYKRELKFGDLIKISVAAANFDKIGFDLYYKLEVMAVEEWLLAAKVKTGMLCFNYLAQKKVPVPDEAIKKLSETPSPR
ncbi:MAG: thioesterase family protein [Bacteroidota bacterium]|nr:thioesterase family protein [Bacteroidota bacterium]